LKLVLLIPDQASFNAETRIERGVLFASAGAAREITAATLPALREAVAGDVDVIALIPSSRIVFIETPLPRVAAAKRDQLVRYAIEDKLTIDPATVHAVVLGEADRPSPAGVVNHIVAAIDRPWLTAAMKWLADAGLTARTAIAENALLPTAAREWSVLLGTRAPYAKRGDGFAFALDAVQLDAPPFAPPFALTLALSETTEKPHALVLQPNDAATEQRLTAEVAQQWQSALSLNVRRAPPLDFVARCKQLGAKSGNLLTGEFAPRRASDAWAARLKPAMILAGVILVCQMLFSVADFWRLDQQRKNIEAEMRTTFQTAFPQASAIVDPALQMERNLANLKRDRGLANESETQQKNKRALAQFAQLVRAVPGITISEVSVANYAATLTGKVASEKQLEALQREVARWSSARIDIAKTNNQFAVTLNTRGGETLANAGVAK
jgi:general secretion pathway protein L